jgi:hypothetical protein
MTINANVELPLRLTTSKAKMLLLLAGSLAFVAIGVWMVVRQPQDAFWGYSSIVFFGACAVVALISMLPSASYLLVTREGFTMCSMFRQHAFRWSDIDSFAACRIATNASVGWNFSSSYTRSKTMRAMNVRLANVEAAFPDTYGMKPEKLAQLLNQLRLKYG